MAALEVVDASAEEMVVVFAELGVDTSLVDDTSLVELLFHMSCMEEPSKNRRIRKKGCYTLQ